MAIKHARISALSAYVPSVLMTNHDLEKMVETSDEWIVKRTGIRTRRYTKKNEFTTDMCVQAARNLQKESGKSLEDVDFIIVATITAEHVMPSIASQVQHHMGIVHAGAFDLVAACAGFVYGLIMAQGLVATGSYRKILVIGAEDFSKFLDFTDRTTCVLFGDGAGAALVEASEEPCMLESITGTHGKDGSALYISSKATHINGTEIKPTNVLVQDGRKVFKWAVGTVSREALTLIGNAGLTIDDIDWFVPHSANARILDAICRNMGFPRHKVLESMEEFGNTSSASIPLAIHKAIGEKKISKGDKLLLFGFGGGLTFAGMVVIWDI